MLQVHVSLRTCGFKSRSEHSISELQSPSGSAAIFGARSSDCLRRNRTFASLGALCGFLGLHGAAAPPQFSALAAQTVYAAIAHSLRSVRSADFDKPFVGRMPKTQHRLAQRLAKFVPMEEINRAPPA